MREFDDERAARLGDVMHSRQRRASFLKVTAWATFVAACLVADIAMACPSCKEALAQNGQGDVVAGYFWSILFLLAMPFTLVGGFSGYFYWLVRRARAQNGAEASPPDASASLSADEPTNSAPSCSKSE